MGGVEGLAVTMRRSRRKRGKARRAAEAAIPEVPVTRLTVIQPGKLGGPDAAETWLGGLAASPESADELVAEGLRIVNRALHAHRLATQDPYGGGVSSTLALATRVGYGTGDELADGRFTDAVEAPPAPGPRSRADALRPQERLAATLGRREATDACETLILRARADLDGGRMREATLQLRVGLEALLAEVEAGSVPRGGGQMGAIATQHAERQIEDLAALSERRAITGVAANEALEGELSAQRAEAVTETVKLCERVLRRRRLLAE
ncbi:MAG: hypothetical protein ACR2G3_02360 [Solirubrobacterales bacterium]